MDNFGFQTKAFSENKDLIDEGIFDDDQVLQGDCNIGLPSLDVDNDDDYFEPIS